MGAREQGVTILPPGALVAADRWGATPWERQQREPQGTYLKFLVYRDMDGRTLAEAAVKLGIHPKVVQGASARWGWVERARAWDNHLRAEEDRTRLATIRKTVRGHAESAEYLMDVAKRAISRPANSQVPAPEWRPTSQMLQAATQAFDKAVFHQRLALGLPTDITRQDVVVRQQLQEAVEVNGALLRILEDYLCDTCRPLILAELERLRQYHAQTAAAATATGDQHL
jgi:hypothetical protein